ncbi:MAG: serine hydrolase domain-containing protein [Pseudomonadota bacterium]
MLRVTCTLLTLFSAFPSSADDSISFKTYMDERMAHHRVAGAAIVLIDEGKIDQEIYLGHANANTQETINEDSVFQVGSVSKPVAAWVAMTMVEAGLLALDEPVSNYLTRWELPPSEFDHNQVTLRRLLSHTAGLSLPGYPGFVEGTPLPTIEASLAGDTNGPGGVYVSQKPGDAFRYSGGGYTLMQLLVEEVTGETFNAVAHRTVIGPLGMTSSSYVAYDDLSARLVTAHGHRRNPIPHHNFRAQAAASLHANARDIARFAIANLNSSGVLRPESVKLMHQPVMDTEPGTGIGLGFFITGDGHIVGHSGSNFGWKARMQFAPVEQRGIVVLTNSESGGAFGYEVVCEWDKTLGAGALQKDCDAFAENAASTAALFNWITLTLYLIFIILAGFTVRMLMRKDRTVGTPIGPVRWLVSILLVVLGVGWAWFFYTALGAYLISGSIPVFATIDFLPDGFRDLSIAVLCVLGVLFLLSLLQPRRPEQIKSGFNG